MYFGGTTALKLAAISRKGIKAGFLASKGAMGQGVALAGHAVFSPIAWAAVSILFIAEAGINYRRLKKGKINKKEFNLRMRNNGVTTLTGIAGSAAGATIGFLIGSAAFPVVGSVIDVILGGVTGGICAKKLTMKTLGLIDKRLEKMH